MNIIGIITARYESTRLPGKVLMKIGNKSMLEHVIERAKKIENINKIVVAVSDEAYDRDIVKCCIKNLIKCFHSNIIDENNLLLRCLVCGMVYNADYILRIPADQPFFDVDAANEVVEYISSSIYSSMAEKRRIERTRNYDYIAHYFKKESQPTVFEYPLGKYIEGIKLDALYTTYSEMKKNKIDWSHYLEHVTSYIYFRPKIFKIKRIIIKELPKRSLWSSINTAEDLERVRKLYKEGKIN